MNPTTVKTTLFYFYLAIIWAMLLPGCSDNSTDPGERTITLSGTVMLDGETDHSGVTVSVYKPVELDTAITNERQNHPGVGIAINQRTEFFWWDDVPVYQTTTTSDGSWRISNVAEGTYHIVAEKEGYGWQAVYQAPLNSNLIQLYPVIQLTGFINQDMTIPANRYVIVSGSVTFEQGKTLTIEPGVTMEFINNGKLDVNGRVTCNGMEGKEVLLFSREASNNSKLQVNVGDNTAISYLITSNVNAGVVVKNSQSVQISSSKFTNGQEAITLFNCDDGQIRNNVIHKVGIGITTNSSSHNKFERNLFIDLNEYGINAFNEDSSSIQYNVFKKCGLIGIGINPEGSPNSIVELHNANIYFNDFKNNQNHFKVGRKAFCIAHQNNFMNAQDFIVRVSEINSADTLDFRNNYWGYTDPNQIADKIFDKLDQPNAVNNVPIVDFTDFQMNPIVWQ